MPIPLICPTLLALAERTTGAWKARRLEGLTSPASLIPALTRTLTNVGDVRTAFAVLLASDRQNLHSAPTSPADFGICSNHPTRAALYIGDNAIADLWATPFASSAYIVTVDVDRDAFLTVMALPDVKDERRAWTVPLRERLTSQTAVVGDLPGAITHPVFGDGTAVTR